MIKYRIFMVDFDDTLHCPFNLGFCGNNADATSIALTSAPFYFDSIEEASVYIQTWVTEQNHDYVILPVVSL